MSHKTSREWRQRFIRHRLQVNASGALTSPDGVFDAQQYGRMKYGSLVDCRAMGLAMGAYMLATAEEFLINEPRLCAPFFYGHVPSAASIMAKYAFISINDARTRAGRERIQSRRIYASRRPTADYAALNPKARAAYMQDCQLQLVTDNLDGFGVVLLDDVVITGNYATQVQNLLTSYSITSFMEFYWACVGENDGIVPEAHVERALNSAAGTDLSLLEHILSRGELVPTLRTLKLLLSNQPRRVTAFLNKVPFGTLVEIYEAMSGTGLELLEAYPATYNVVASYVQQALRENARMEA